MTYLKPFDTFFRATPDELDYNWDYYKCNNCQSELRLYNPKTIKCKYCQSQDLLLIDKQNIENI